MTTTSPALILNEMTLGYDETTYVEFARRIGAELGHDLDKMCTYFTYLTERAIYCFDADALPVLEAMGNALDVGRGIEVAS